MEMQNSRCWLMQFFRFLWLKGICCPRKSLGSPVCLQPLDVVVSLDPGMVYNKIQQSIYGVQFLGGHFNFDKFMRLSSNLTITENCDRNTLVCQILVPTCAYYAWWALMHHNQNVCLLRGPKLTRW